MKLDKILKNTLRHKAAEHLKNKYSDRGQALRSRLITIVRDHLRRLYGNCQDDMHILAKYHLAEVPQYFNVRVQNPTTKRWDNCFGVELPAGTLPVTFLIPDQTNYRAIYANQTPNETELLQMVVTRDILLLQFKKDEGQIHMDLQHARTLTGFVKKQSWASGLTLTNRG